ncbi:hypothetical protein BDN70DRAFT_929443 [Pholiota conissans]|uniref:Uncharacterized protein n=1 Tax=Pholiota conissans TaxID=109636 RepID=A0A9P5Z8X6_9AGAR|nr:hypothetical protein BDN70DRAFT_929443 [Pholiota conissans]
MRLTAITATLLAGAGLVAAVPIRVIVVSSSAPQDIHPAANIRFGHAVQPLAPAVAKMSMSSSSRVRRPCNGRMSRFRQKGIEISNTFRAALGLPLIDPNAHHAPMRGPFNILPINPEEVQFLKPMEPSPNDKYVVVKHDTNEMPAVESFKPLAAQDMRNHMHHGGPHRHHHPHHHHDIPFIMRLHFSLMNLGLWEGRAVAFVLGCGIGVLLRMFWVLAVVAYRAVKRRPEEDEYSHITIFEEVEVAPPHYTYPVDEKVAIEAAEPTEPAAATEEAK